MKRDGHSLKTFSLVALFCLCTMLQLTHGIIAIIHSQTPRSHAAKEKGADRGNQLGSGGKKSLPFILTVDKGLITGNPFRN